MGKKKPFFYCSENVKLYRLSWDLIEPLFKRHPKLIITKLKFFFVMHKFDLVIDTFIMDCNLTLPAIKGRKIKHLVWSNFSYEYFRQVKHEQIALKKILEEGSDILVLTKEDRKMFIEYQNIPAEKIHQIYNPLTIDVSTYTSHNTNKVLSIGRFASEKGFDMLIKAWKIVESKIPDWELEIWGDTGLDTGDVYSTFESIKPERLSLHPATQNICEKYEQASIYVMSSRHEGFPLVLLEASAYSLPIVSFDCPNGPREIIINDYNGYLVEPNNIESLASAIIRLIKDEKLRNEMSHNSYLRSKDFQIEKILPQWEQLIENVVVDRAQ